MIFWMTHARASPFSASCHSVSPCAFLTTTPNGARVTAIEAGDGDGAGVLMRRHLEGMRAELAATLEHRSRRDAKAPPPANEPTEEDHR